MSTDSSELPDSNSPVGADEEEPEIYSLHKQDSGWALSRRGLIAAGAGVALTLGARNSSEAASATQVVFAHERAVYGLAVTPDGKTLLSTGDDGLLKFWSLPDGALFKTVQAHSGPVHAISVSPDGKTLCSGRDETQITFWTLPDAKPREGTPPVSKASAALPDYRRGARKQARRKAPTPHGHNQAVSALAITPDNGIVCAASFGGEIKIRSLSGTGSDLSLSGSKNSDLAVAIQPDGKVLYSGGRDKKVTLWSLPDGKKILDLKKHKGPVQALAFSPDGSTLFSGSADRTILLWSSHDHKPQKTLTGHSLGVGALAASPDGKWLISAGSDKRVMIWSLPEGKLAATLEGHTGRVTALAVTPDSKTLISGSDDRTIRLWSLPEGETLRLLMDLAANTRDVKGMRYQGQDVYGRTITYVLPCGSPIPAGAVCTCNCVPGSIGAPGNYLRTYSGGGYCSCDLVCTCNTVCTCQSVCSCVSNRTTYTYTYHYWHPT